MDKITKKDIELTKVVNLGNIDIESIRIEVYKNTDWLIASGSYNTRTNMAHIQTECDYAICPYELTELVESKKLTIE